MQWRALRPRPGIEVCRHSYTTVSVSLSGRALMVQARKLKIRNYIELYEYDTCGKLQ